MSDQTTNTRVYNFLVDLQRMNYTDVTLGPKIEKALKMLGKEKNLLFIDKGTFSLISVVKSQSRPDDLEYATKINSDGSFFCGTQNLNHCGGLRGKICKHVILSMVAAIKEGSANARELLSWVTLTTTKKPLLDKQEAASIFSRYKAAIDGEIEWRPVELFPEDFLSF